jgi:LysR family glycine cleavage system transcriptional activator
MSRDLPPMEATEAFVAAARAGSFREGASQIGLSPSAFSRRIQLLEAFVGQPLFDRSVARLALTEAGERYLAEIEPALERLGEATRMLRQSGPRRRIGLAVSESFAVTWLMPRLSDLQREQDIEVELHMTRDPAVLRSGAAHLGVWGAVSPAEGFACEPLLEADFEAVPVAAPAMADGRTPPASLSELSSHRLLAARTPPDSWSRWMAALGHAPASPPAVQRFERVYLAYEAAANGIGVALATPLVSERYFENASIVPCMPARAGIGAGYQVVYGDPDYVRRPVIRALVDWLERQAEDSRARFDDWCASARAA